MNEHDKLTQALEEVSDQYLAEAAGPRRKKFPWLEAVAGTLAAAMLLVLLSPLALMAGGLWDGGRAADPAETPGSTQAYGEGSGIANPSGWYDSLDDFRLTVGRLSAPEYPEMVPYPNDAINTNDNQGKYELWKTALKVQYSQPEGYEAGLSDFFARSIPLFLGDPGENAVCSPLNIYMALAMLAETTGGESRTGLLSVLNAESIEALRTQAGHVWNAHYRTDGAAACLLANSLWLNEGYAFDQATVDALADSYYASVYQGALGSEAMNSALRAWLDVQTQGLLGEYSKNIELSSEDALALASTVFFQAKWDSKFWETHNTEGVFHSPGGDMDVTYMNKELTYGPYYYGEDYGAVRLDLEGAGVYGSAVWLILPDEGYDPGDILESGHALNMILGNTQADSTQITVHLSLPKFDISAETDLREGLTALGLGDLFSEKEADFSGILRHADGARLSKASHAARVAIDEEGVTAAAYTVMATFGAAVPPEEEVYFTLDRPFLFVITSPDGLPLFAGVVNEP